MSLDAMLGDLVRENEGALLPLVRKAYELGYREALAARPAPPPPEPAAAIAVPAPSPAAPLFAEPPPEPSEVEPDPEAPEEADDDDADGPRPVRASLTIGGLLKRITRHFGLDRFDLEVRVVDPRSHRHLMRDVRLSRYQVETK
ncbi:MAG: hypothetical protein ACYC8T_17020 [Myxococcaceae bacterium]